MFFLSHINIFVVVCIDHPFILSSSVGAQSIHGLSSFAINSLELGCHFHVLCNFQEFWKTMRDSLEMWGIREKTLFGEGKLRVLHWSRWSKHKFVAMSLSWSVCHRKIKESFSWCFCVLFCFVIVQGYLVIRDNYRVVALYAYGVK